MQDHLSRVRRPSDGFSVVEALVSLLVIGLLLSVLRPLIGTGVQRSHQMALRGLEAREAALGEALFQRLLADVTQAPVTRIDELNRSPVSGDGRSVTLRVRARSEAVCAPAGWIGQVELEIRQAASGSEIVCRSPLAEQPVYSWPSGEARFSYSPDGTSWFDRWPPSEEDLKRAGPGRPGGRVFPILRFTAGPEGAVLQEWVAVAGALQPPDYRFDMLSETP